MRESDHLCVRTTYEGRPGSLEPEREDIVLAPQNFACN